MKTLKIMFFVFSAFAANAQIFTQTTTNGSILITPKGLKGKTNSNNDLSNVVLGPSALNSFTSGTYNTVIGVSALTANTSGCHNVANGYFCLLANTSGSYITANGFSALISNNGGNNNTADGYYSGSAIVSGSNDTFLGYAADATSDFNNSTAIGANAKVNDNNKVRIGDANVKVIEGQVAWSYPSDRRLKENIQYTSRLGLDFITKLQTVSYNYIADKNKNRYDGFIAQDIEQAMKDLNVPFSGLKKSDDGTYSLAYSDFVMPLVNAVKEQQQTIEKLENQLAKMEKLLASLSNKELPTTGK